MALAIAERGRSAPALVRPAAGWSRDAILEWLIDLAAARADMLIGLDLSPALPFDPDGGFFPGWSRSPRDARSLWAAVEAACAGDTHLSANGFLADAEAGRHFRLRGACGDLFGGGGGRLRICEQAQRASGFAPSSCFNLVGAAQVGKSSLTGMRVLHRLAGRVPVWPFDPVPTQGPLIVEIYTTIAARAAGLPKGRSKIRDHETLDRALAALGSDPTPPLARYDDHLTDAIVTAAWLRRDAGRAELWHPPALTRGLAQTEGWTFGVV